MNNLIARAVASASATTGPPSPLTSWTATGPPRRTSTGLTVVHLQQRHAGIPLRGCARSVRFDADGDLDRVTGEAAAVDPHVALQPTIAAKRAAYAACRHLADEVLVQALPEIAGRVSNRRPVVLARPGGPEAATLMRKIPFREPVLASLTIFERRELVWDVRLRLPGPGGSYAVLVSAAAEEPHIVAVERRSAHAVSGRVHLYDPDTDPVERSFSPSGPPSLSFGGATIPLDEWCDGDALAGNAVVCRDDRGDGFEATPHGPDLRFAAPASDGLEQVLVDAFHACNLAHDLFLLLGFDERAGNFQKVNAPGVGMGGDPLHVVAWDAEIPGAAFFLNEPDGSIAELHAGRMDGRHVGHDAGVVIHEYVHGVTSRVIGGSDFANPLTRPQSRALGEGFSDYWALTVLNRIRRSEGLPERFVYGAWASGDAATGLRNFACDDAFPGTYGDLGTPSFRSDHDAGQVWCAALLDVHRVLALQDGADAADERAWQLVFDSLQLLHPGPRGPTFLHARDAVLSAYDAAVGAGRLPSDPALRREVVTCFTRRGMGPAARSPTAGFADIREDTGHGGGGA